MKNTRGKLHIVADNDIPFLKGVLEDAAEVDYLPGKAIDAASVKDADALIIRTRTCCDASLLKGSSVKYIASATIGFDHIDTGFCEREGIRWTNAPGCNSSSVEQYILSVLLTLAGRHAFTLNEKTIGIVGVGHVGSKINKICKALNMNILLNDPPRQRKEGGNQFVDLSLIQKEADIISLHVPLTQEGHERTKHLVNDEFLSGLKKMPIIINSSRGGVVDSKALIKALKSRNLRAAVLDVWENEPDIDLELLSLTDIATPHIAGYSVDGKANATGMSVRALSRFFGLGLDNWHPDNLPGPGFDNMIVDGSRFGFQELFMIVARKTYDVLRDDDVLRKNPARFEQLRANYPVRREPDTIRVNIINDFKSAGPVLAELGYHTRTDHCE